MGFRRRTTVAGCRWKTTVVSISCKLQAEVESVGLETENDSHGYMGGGMFFGLQMENDTRVVGLRLT